jgi:glyoxylase-like metal-dependent hydrolase (beta-lactamase superfamily II)
MAASQEPHTHLWQQQMATGPERLVPNVYRIDGFGLPRTLNILAIAGEDGWSIVDTGISGSPKRIQAGLAALGVSPDALARIYLTHHHTDHVGGLPGMRAWAPNAEIVAPEYEAEIITGKRPMDASSNPVNRAIQRFNKLSAAPVDRTVGEGDTVAGFRVIATPGHTLGHTSLLSEKDGLLLTADAFGALPRKVRVGVRKAFCTDPALAKRSAEKLLAESYATVVFSHGPVLRENPKDRLREIVANCNYA